MIGGGIRIVAGRDQHGLVGRNGLLVLKHSDPENQAALAPEVFALRFNFGDIVIILTLRDDLSNSSQEYSCAIDT